MRVHEDNQERADTAKPHFYPDVRALLQVFLSFAEQGMVPGTGLEPASPKAADFLHTASFDASWAVRALDYAFALACALGAPRLVSTPSRRSREGLGSALPRPWGQGFHRI